jgi:hypothetical protein
MEVLRLYFLPDDEWLGELTLVVATDGYAGVGAAWFSKDSLREFGKAITEFPLSREDPPRLSGGLGGNDSAPAQELVGIKFEPHNILGALRATVHVERENWDSNQRNLVMEATVRFLVTYGDLARFGSAMIDLIEGRADEAVLTSTP